MSLIARFADTRDRQHMHGIHPNYQYSQHYCRAIAIVSRSSALMR
jgi:hypothetical protein